LYLSRVSLMELLKDGAAPWYAWSELTRWLHAEADPTSRHVTMRPNGDWLVPFSAFRCALRYFHLEIAARRRGVHSLYDVRNVVLYESPTSPTQGNDRDLPIR
jgi:hypothetical protein